MKLLGPDDRPMSLAEIPGVLRLLRDAADAAIERAKDDEVEGPVNWADLGCSKAEHFEDSEGGAGWRVWIDEADPTAIELQQFVRADLAEHGWPGVEVVTEW